MSDKTGPSTYSHQDLALDLANRFQEQLESLEERVKKLESHVHDALDLRTLTSGPIYANDPPQPETEERG